MLDSLVLFAPIDPPTPTPENIAQQPQRITEGPPGFLHRLGSNEGDLNRRFVSVRGMSTARDGTLYAAESSRGVWVFTPEGQLISTFGEDELNDSYDVAIGPEGDLFVADYGNNDIVRFSPDGTVVNRWGEVGEAPEQFGLLSPQRIAVGPDGIVYALDSRVSTEGANAANSVMRFRPDGTFLERIDLPAGTAPNDLAVDSEGSLYLAETVSGAVTKVDGRGQILGRIGETVTPEGIIAGAVDVDRNNNIYVATWNNGILKFSPGGVLLASAGSIAEPGTIPEPGQFTLPNGIAAAPNNVAWVSDNSGEYSAITALRLDVDQAALATANAQATAVITDSVAQAPLFRQWATSATVSSQYGEEYGPDGLIGQPEVESCTSNPDAWAPVTFGTQETISLGFDEPVFASQVQIHQTHQPGAITEVGLIDERGQATQVYSGTASLMELCPVVLEVNFEPTLSRIVSVTITLDQEPGDNWTEIDAVELIGVR
jgi:sugar lactone lactonase YvrE